MDHPEQRQSEFISLATHQLRAPLAALKGYASLLRDGDMGELPTAAQEGAERIFRSAAALEAIIDDYLDAARLELGGMKYAFEALDLRTLVADAIDELGPALRKPGVSLTFIHGEPGLEYRVTGDRCKLKHAVTNILDNSLKYTPAGTIEAELSRDPSRDAVVLTVTDTGIGISPEALPQLFRKFSRTSEAEKADARGTGLGLYIAKEIIQAHGGAIRAESDGAGKGSRFTIELRPFGKA